MPSCLPRVCLIYLEGGPMRLRWISVLLLAVSPATVYRANKLNAQTTTSGGLTGVVTDPSHALVPDAGIEIKDSAKGTTQSMKTDREGVYRFFFLAPGRYTLSVSHVGFQTENRGVNVLLGPPVTVNVTLEVATERATVNVTGEAPLIQSENGDVSTTMNQQQVAEVPNPGGDITYVAQIAPGAVMNTDQSGLANFSILGMPGTSNLFFLDGMSENDNGLNLNLAGSLNMLLGQNQIQEATVVSTGYSGQFGGAAGATINFITKSGSNQLHGNAQYYWNGRVFNANDWFNNANGQGRPFDVANQWAGSLGGPIQKDKLFFFFDSEGTRLQLSQNFFVVIPSSQFEALTIKNIDSRFGSNSASDAFYNKIFALYNAAQGASSATPGSFTDPLGCTEFSDPNTGLGVTVPCAAHFFTTRGLSTSDTLTSGRVDWNANSNDRAFLRLQYDSGHNAVVVDPISSVFDAFGHNPWWQGQLMETHIFNASSASQFLVGGYYLGPIFQVQNPSQTLAAFPNYLNFGASNTFTNLGDGLAFPGGRPTTQFQISEDGVKTWGNQKFGFGANFERIYWSTLVNTDLSGILTPQTLDAFYQGGVDPASPETDYTELLQGFASHTSERISFYTFGLYGQDEWHARRNLTLTVALRAEHRSDPVCRQSCFARLAGNFGPLNHDPSQPYDQAILSNQKQAFAEVDNILWTPRFSFAWQPFGVTRNTVIRGGVGIFYDPVSGNHTLTLSSNPPIFNIYPVFRDNLAPGERTSLAKDATASNDAFLNGLAANQTLAQIQAASSDFTPPGITNPATLMRAPQYQRWSLELQQAFGARTSANIGYFGNHGIRELVQNPNANAYGFGSLPTGPCTSAPVPPCADPRFTGVTQLATNAVSNYNGLVASFRHRFSRWTPGFLQLNYAYSHAFDEVSNGGLYPFTFGSSIYPQDPSNLRGSYGPAEYDVRHSLNANYVWEVPVKAALRGRGPNRLVEGWQISGTIFARTGFPYTVIDNAEGLALNKSNFFGTIYAVPVAPLQSSASCGEGAAYPPALRPCQPPELSSDGVTPNPAAPFVQSGCETGFNTGTLPAASSSCGGRAVSFAQGRNHFRGPGYFNTDFTIMKNTKLRESAMFGIGFQFFNSLNHPNFGFPDNYSSDQTFGQISYLEQSPTSIVGSGIGGDAAPRMIQLKVQLQF
jgi:Carboxypeptidase regulatory-like domain